MPDPMLSNIHHASGSPSQPGKGQGRGRFSGNGEGCCHMQLHVPLACATHTSAAAQSSSSPPFLLRHSQASNLTAAVSRMWLTDSRPVRLSNAATALQAPRRKGGGRPVRLSPAPQKFQLPQQAVKLSHERSLALARKPTQRGRRRKGGGRATFRRGVGGGRPVRLSPAPQK